MEVQPFLVSSPISPTCHPSSVTFLNLVPVPSGDSLVVLVVKNPPANPGDIRDVGSIAVLGRSSGEGNGNPLQYSCLANPHRQRSLAGYSLRGCKESDMTEATQHSIMTGIYHYIDRGVLGVAKNQTQLKQLSTHLPPEIIAVASCTTKCVHCVLWESCFVFRLGPQCPRTTLLPKEEGWGCVWVCSRVGGNY